MIGQPISLLGVFVAVSVWSAEAKNVTVAKSLAINAVGRPRPSVVRSERQHPAAIERHSAPGLDMHPAALGELGSSFISETGADAIGAHVAEAFEPVPHKRTQSMLQSNISGEKRTKEDPPTLSIIGKIYLRQPPDHMGNYNAREWFCDACSLVAGTGQHGGSHKGCYTVQDFVCASGEKCLMDGASCYFGRVEVPQGIQVTYYSGFVGDPSSGAWDNACVGRTDRGTTSDPSFPELKGVVPRSPASCAMRFEQMPGYSCETGSAGENDWKGCGTDGHAPPDSHATAGSSLVLAAAAVMLAFFRS